MRRARLLGRQCPSPVVSAGKGVTSEDVTAHSGGDLGQRRSKHAAQRARTLSEMTRKNTTLASRSAWKASRVVALNALQPPALLRAGRQEAAREEAASQPRRAPLARRAARALAPLRA